MIKISGNSNYKVSVIDNKNQFYIVKESFTKDESQRLKKQIEKQENFIDTVIYKPDIIDKKESKYIFEYIRSYDMINYLNVKSIYHIFDYIDKILSFIHREIKESIVQEIDVKILQTKINTIEKNLLKFRKEKIIESCFRYLRENLFIFRNGIPIGRCHGDLTFSNMLIDYGDQVYFIDFLDNFIESPLFDIIKIRQDIVYGYIFQTYKETYDKHRLSMIFDFMNERMNREFGDYKMYFRYLDIMNFLRILQYSKNDHMDGYIINVLSDILS
tara:strand:+ start:339 stop:1154 length:816 start_codon:yes stop_codon:yes gene_type:complete